MHAILISEASVSTEVVGSSLAWPEGAVKGSPQKKSVRQEGCLRWMNQKTLSKVWSEYTFLISEASDLVVEKASSHVMPEDATR